MLNGFHALMCEICLSDANVSKCGNPCCMCDENAIKILYFLIKDLSLLHKTCNVIVSCDFKIKVEKGRKDPPGKKKSHAWVFVNNYSSAECVV